MTGVLRIVSTPIGNLEDITLRALRVLRESDAIAAEDTRVTRKLLSHFDIHTPMIAYHQHSTGRRAEEILELLQSGKSVALVSDAGTPGISDPGHELIAMCIAEKVTLEPVPGPTAAIAALVVSGFGTSHFAFDGFPPRKLGERLAFFASLSRDTRTLVFYEAPSRLVKTLESMRKELGDRKVVIVRETTKLHEEHFRGTVSEAIERYSPGQVRGEIVIVVHGASANESAPLETKPDELNDRLLLLVREGLSERDAIRRCMIEFKLPKRVVYSSWLRLKESSQE